MKPLALLFALLLTLAPAHAERKKLPSLGLTVAGTVVLGLFYVSSLAMSIRFEEPELAVPVLGPLIDLRRCHDCTAGPIGQGEVAGLVLITVLQAAGVAMLAAGLTPRRSKGLTLGPTGAQIRF